MTKYLLSMLVFCLSIQSGKAQENQNKSKLIEVSGGVESNLLQFAQADQLGTALTIIPRYTYFFNTGFDVNVKMNKHIKLFTGVNIKNIGLIIKQNDSVRDKHRVYTIGAPFGIKLHSTNNKIIFKTGVDMSMAFNYKHKHIVNDTKTKESKYFSNRTALFFPSLYAGLSVLGFSVTASYYLNNFFEPLNPYVQDMNAHLFTIGLGLNIDNDTFKAQQKKDKKKD